MRSTLVVGLAFVLVVPVLGLATAPARFQKLTDHYLYLQGSPETGNVGAFISDSGILLVNPPAPNDSAAVLEALKRVSSRPVRWIVSTDYRKENWSAPSPLLAQGASALASQAAFERSRSDAAGAPVSPRPPSSSAGTFVFGRQMRLYPGGIEVKVFAPQAKSRAGDVAIFVPAERVLQVGDIFLPGSFPSIQEDSGEGAALGWIEALKQVVDLVPLLKSAMPQPKPDPAKPGAEEKTLEESIAVVPGRGPASNLQEMKTLLEQAQKMRAEMTRAITAGRSRESALASPALAPFRSLENFETFAARLYDALSAAKP